MPAAAPSGNSPSSTMPSTLAASAPSTSPASPPGVTTANATTPRARAAATNSGAGDRSRRQLTGVPVSSSSERVSAHGHRTGTQAEGGGAAAHRKGTKPMAATQRPARIHILLGYDIWSGISSSRRQGRPNEPSGLSRQTLRNHAGINSQRHGAKQPNVKLFLRGPLGSGLPLGGSSFSRKDGRGQYSEACVAARGVA